MDWKNIDFDWNHARAFLATAEEGSFSAAAKVLGMTQPTLGRQVAAFEQALGIALFERVGRGLTLTPSGVKLLDHVRTMANAATKLSLDADGNSQQLQGLVTIACSDVIALYFLMPLIAKLRSDWPMIRVEIITSIRPSDLLRREADIAIRHFRPTEPDLVARKLGTLPATLYASPAYLAKLGHPQTLAGFSDACFIGFDRTSAMTNHLNAIGFNLSDENFVLLSENHNLQWEAACAGHGIGTMPKIIGDADPRVSPILPESILPPFTPPVWLTAHRDLHTNARIRLVYDLLITHLRPRLDTPGT